MAKPAKLEFATKSSGDSYTAAEANLVHAAIDAVIDDYASISEGVDADTLEGSTKAEVQTHAPASHGNEVHDVTFEDQANKGAASGYAGLDASVLVPTAQLGTGTAAASKFLRGDQTWAAGVSGVKGKDGKGFVNNIATLWDKADGDVPEGFEEVSELTGTNFTIIKYVGGEEMTNITHNIQYEAGATVTITVSNQTGGDQVNVTNGSGYAPFVGTPDEPINIQVEKSDAGDASYHLTAYKPDSATEVIDIWITVLGESNIDVLFMLPVACWVYIRPD